MMMTQFNLQPQTKNPTSRRPAESQPLHVEIQGVYAKEIAPHIAPLQKKMKWYVVIERIIAVLICLAITLMISRGLFRDNFGLYFMPIVSVCSAIGIIACFLKSEGFLFQNGLTERLVGDDYQNLIIKPLLKHICLSLNITSEGEFPQGVYKQSQLFTKPYENFFSPEVVSDNLQRNFTLGSVITTYTTGSGKNRQTHIIFSGLMARISCPKATTGKTFLFPDGSEKLLGGFAKQLQGMTDHAGAKLVTMDNPDFEKAFKVYTTDSVQAHYLLSTKWLEKLTDFQKELNVPISIALHSGMCYVALHGYESPFTPQQDLQQALTASGVYTQYIRLKKLFDQLEVLQQIGSTLNDD
ncbi:MAG: DUF3137 domain-containing protein [Vampirovibrio sp.]|nr:DUF3137 domain-containing protein [Vampirovibrio sp.]